jgi:hypothetical protein
MSEEHALLHQKLDELKQMIDVPWWEHPILSTRQAMKYVGITSLTTFYRRMREWNIKPCDKGFWTRSRIDGAMHRISKKTYTPS